MDIDVTIVLQLSLFLVLLVSLNGLLIQPFLRVLVEREEKIAGARSDAETLQRLGDQDMHSYQAAMREARGLAEKERQRGRDSARQEEGVLLSRVRRDIAGTLAAMRDEVGAAEAAARAQLEAERDQLARQVVQKILDREVTS